MNIGIDARSSLGKRKGVGRYLVNLLRHMPVDAHKNVIHLYFQQTPDIGFSDAYRMNIVRGRHALWRHLHLPLRMLRDKIDLHFSPSYMLPLVSAGKRIVSIHDVTWEVEPSWFEPKEQRHLSLMARYAAKTSDAVITCSQSSRNDIIKYYGVSPEKVHAVYLGADSSMSPPSDETVQLVLADLAITRAYMVHVGSIFPRRNLMRILDAFVSVRREADLDLLLVGAVMPPEVRARAKELGLEKYIVELPYVEDQLLPAIYRGSVASLYPSLYEGFGLPALEAMACGTPLVTSNLSSLPEVVCDAALLVDPYSPSEIAQAVLSVCHDQALRNTMVERGIAQAAKFSWKKTSAETLKVFEDTMRN